MTTAPQKNKLEYIYLIQGEIELLSGLHIGGGDAQMKIGGIDNEVVKDIKGKPYIPGSSLKGKIRTLLEWHLGFYNITGKQDEKGEPSNQEMLNGSTDNTDPCVNLVRLFGSKPNTATGTGIITRLSFWDCPLSKSNNDMETSEAKMENSIDRKTGTAISPRTMERVPVGNKFDFKLSVKIFSEDKDEKTNKATNMINLIKAGLALLQLDALGGSGSRGYGKIHFNNLTIDGEDFSITDKSLNILRDTK